MNKVEFTTDLIKFLLGQVENLQKEVEKRDKLLLAKANIISVLQMQNADFCLKLSKYEKKRSKHA